MLKAVETVTIVHRVPARDGDKYECCVVHGASWYWQERAAVDSGLKEARILKCRIPITHLSEGFAIEPGDRIAQGELADVTGAQFAALPRTHGAATIMAVHRNTFGTCPHIYIEGT